MALVRGVEILGDGTKVDGPVMVPTGKIRTETIPLGEIMEKSRELRANTEKAMENMKDEESRSDGK
jgi:hypothetical protein